ncbi:MAG: ATP-binding protein [Haliscomenobacter sp.]|uniref:ATP-binding protein n=1 Tax=Haliscomenobacter sp. TaxID=2717303 RepID=UPI0029A9C5E7|nr:ATP-binding protein [Haliscomenobacter sp.]MDX2067185.1 ATP-binding protein [Haliscomenobacter sp.]
MKYLSLIFLFCTIQTLAQSEPVFRIDSLPVQGIVLDKGWKWHAGDNPEWVKEGYDDSGWESIDPMKDILELPQLWRTKVGWFRLKLRMDSAFTNKPIALSINQVGATEYFLDGQKLAQYGVFRVGEKEVLAVASHRAARIFFILPIHDAKEHVLAIRYGLQKKHIYLRSDPIIQPFHLKIVLAESLNELMHHDMSLPFIYIRLGINFSIFLFHLVLFVFNPVRKANLYFVFYACMSFMFNLFSGIGTQEIQFLWLSTIIRALAYLTIPVSNLFLLIAVYDLFNRKLGLAFWILFIYFLIGTGLFLTGQRNVYFVGYVIPGILPLLEIIRVTFIAKKHKLKGANIIFIGTLSYLIFIVCYFMAVLGYLPAGPKWILGHIYFSISFLSIPISLSIYLAIESSLSSRDLKLQLLEVEKLSAEKQQILATQNETLERQVAERTAQLQASQAQLIQREKLASLGELTAGIAHEIQNPLNFVNNFAEVSAEMAAEMKEEMDKGETEEAKFIADDLILNLQKINHHGKRASSIVKNMLEHSRSSTGEKALTNLNTLLDECLRLSYHGMRAQEKDFQAEYSLDLEADLPEVVVVAQDIGRVLLNLFNNAFYELLQKRKQLPADTAYTPMVSASTRKTEQGIEIRISDNGSGIPEAIRDKIFQPFFTTKPTGEGTGLGLSLAYDIITKGHNGSLALDTQPGEGSSFIITLPL